MITDDHAKNIASARADILTKARNLMYRLGCGMLIGETEGEEIGRQLRLLADVQRIVDACDKP